MGSILASVLLRRSVDPSVEAKIKIKSFRFVLRPARVTFSCVAKRK